VTTIIDRDNEKFEGASGYSHPAYAESLAEFGVALPLPESGGWLLEREIEAFPDHDATGCYPLFSCKNWSRLRHDLDALNGNLVSVALVTDPFGEYDVGYLNECFGDVVVPFKQHYITDLRCDPETYIHPHHRRNARKALRELRVEQCTAPVEFLDDWIKLYEVLVERHHIVGIPAFSRNAFAKQLTVPGVAMLRAVRDDVTDGMLLWYVQGQVANYHLGAYSQRGYEMLASFALFSHAIEYFRQQGLRWMNLGGAAGIDQSRAGGLNRFKQGWATGTRTAYFCGRVFDRQRYDMITDALKIPPTNYFPAYRLGEFG
jgi:hypothetical protein